MRAAGVRGDLDDFAQMYVVGIQPSFVARARRAGVNVSDVDELVQLQALAGTSSPPIFAATPQPRRSDPDDG